MKNALRTANPATVEMSYNDGTTTYAKTYKADFLGQPTDYPTAAATENLKPWTNIEAIAWRSDGTTSAPAVAMAKGTASIDYLLNADYTMSVTFTMTITTQGSYTFASNKEGTFRVCTGTFAINGDATV